MKKQLFLHIGGPKTGTTTLQIFLAKNRDALRAKGFGYPGTADAHWGICANLPEHTAEGIRSRPNTFIRRCLREIGRSSCHTHIMSAECLSGLGTMAKKLREIIPETLPVTVVYYARRQDSLIESWYNQKVKSSHFRLSRRLDRGFFTTACFMNQFDHSLVIGPWAEAFGREHVVVRCFEKQQMTNGDIIDDFSEIAGLAADGSLHRPPRDMNVSLDLRHMEFIRLCNRALTDIPEINDLFTDIGLLRSRCFSNQQRRHLLSPEMRTEILEYYEESNRAMAREFLGRPDGRLFLEPLPDPAEPFEPFPGLTVPETALIFEEILRGLDRKQQGMEPAAGLLSAVNKALNRGLPAFTEPMLHSLRAQAHRPPDRKQTV